MIKPGDNQTEGGDMSFSIDLVTLFPEMSEILHQCGVCGNALTTGRCTLRMWNPREFSSDKRRSVDDRPYGGGAGMVLRYEPLQAALQAARQCNPAAPVLFLDPQGERLQQQAVKKLAQNPGVILLAGRYAGVDQRLLETEVDQFWSIGDYVLSGGELPALVLIDAIIRLLPGALGNTDSAAGDSFSFANGLLGAPQYTRPESVHGMSVPEVLLSGDHAEITRWRKKQALGNTWLKRPDLLLNRSLDAEEKTLLEEFQQEHT